MNIADLVEIWRVDTARNTLAAPATDSYLQRAETALGFRLPVEFCDFYRHCNGADLLDGNLTVFPLVGDATRLGIVDATHKYRGWNWLIPEELVLFGHNGAGDVFGLWLDRTVAEKPTAPVVEVGEIFEPDCLALAGTSFARFLVGWTAYYTLLCGRNEAVLDRIGLPEALRFAEEDLDDEAFTAIRRWADPGLANPNASPYRDRLNPEGLRAKLGLV